MTNTSSPEPAPEIPFTPLPCKRHNGWSAERQREFIRQLSRIGLVGPAAKAVGMSRQSAYALRHRAEQDEAATSFADAWDRALKMGRDNAQDHAIDRALEGYEVPYFYGGLQRGTVRRYNDRLLIAALNQVTKQRDNFVQAEK